MDGEATPAQIGALSIALRMKGETVDEIAGAARAMRARAGAASLHEPASARRHLRHRRRRLGHVQHLDLAAIVVAAACGVRVAKHGNRALSSRCGSADVLEALGVHRSPAPARCVERCLREAGIGFLFAPAFHPAMRHAAAPRRSSASRTIFNLLGPLTNPAGVRHQVIGVFDAASAASRWRARWARSARARAFVVHGAGGLDEIRGARRDPGGRVARDGSVRSYKLTPATSASTRPIRRGWPAATPARTPRCCAPCWPARPARRAPPPS